MRGLKGADSDVVKQAREEVILRLAKAIEERRIAIPILDTQQFKDELRSLIEEQASADFQMICKGIGADALERLVYEHLHKTHDEGSTKSKGEMR